MDKDMDKEVTMGDESRHQDADANHTVQEEHNSLLARVRSWFPSREDLSRWPWWKQKLVKHFLPLGLFVALVWGLAWPLPGRVLAEQESGGFAIVSTVNVAGIFFLQGLGLKTDDMKAALRAYKAVAYGVIAILGITGCYGFIMVHIPFEPREFQYGAALFCVVPTTLTSGVTMVNQANGNGVLALLLTAGTNLLGIVTTPFFFKALVASKGASGGASLDPVSLLSKLLLSVLMPLVVGKLLRESSKSVQEFVKKHKTPLSLLTNFLLVMIVWMTVSKSQSKFVGTPGGDIMVAIVAMIILHGVWLCQNYAMCRHVLKLPEREYRADLILTSQKTLPVTITVLSFLPDSLGEKGLMTIPPIVGHMSQLFIDSAIISHWINKDDKATAEESKGEDNGDHEMGEMGNGGGQG